MIQPKIRRKPKASTKRKPRAAAARAPRASSITTPRTMHEQRVDWGGVLIVNPPSTVVRRLLPGRGTSARPVEMDIRGFVPSRPSSVIKDWIHARLKIVSKQNAWLAPALAQRRERTWYDLLADTVADVVYREIPYRYRNGDAWQLPEETLALGVGDCEDRATLLASALVAAGISPYNVRVALGTITVKKPRLPAQKHAHAWVVYRSEHGSWSALEPVPVGSGRHPNVTFSYSPEYVFNGDHQWSTEALDLPPMRHRWNKLEPTFHGEIHQSLIVQAAHAAGLPTLVVSRFGRSFTTLFGNRIDEPDLARYDPRHHFDTALIPHAWGHVLGWLRNYRNKPLTDAVGIRCVCWAAHAIGDFYAHSTYAHFLAREGRGAVPYDPETGRPALAFDYANDPDFQRAALSYYPAWWNPSHFDRFAKWRGHAISGRYSLKGDSHGIVEKFVNLAPGDAFPTPAARSLAGSLPHHDEIAVDEEHGSNKLYGPQRYAQQYRLRYALALAHITAALKKHPALG
jgi:hypothetical protein